MTKRKLAFGYWIFKLAFLTLLFIHCGKAQDTISSDQFFAAFELQFPIAEKEVFQGVKFPIIEAYDLRTETRDFDLEQQELTVRINPSTPKIMRAQENIYRHIHSKPNFEYSEKYCDSKLDHHLDWLSLQYQVKQLSKLRLLEVVLLDKEQLLEMSLMEGKLVDKEMIELVMDRSAYRIDSQELESEIESFGIQYKLEDRVYLFDRLQPISEIGKSILDVQIRKSENVMEDEFDLSLIDKEIALEKAEQKQFFDFAQFRYQGPRTDLLGERVNLGAALRIPTSGNRKLRIEELKLERKEILNEMKLDEEELLQNLDKREKELSKFIRFYSFFKTHYDTELNKMEDLKKNFIESGVFNPSNLLEIEEWKIQMSLKQLDLEEEIYEHYIEYLYLTGKLCDRAVSNFLK